MKFEDMDVWKKSTRLSVSIYKELSVLKDYGFKDQITRSGLSIPSNIAEGFGHPFVLSLSKDEVNMRCSWFDKLTTNGKNLAQN